MNPFKKIAIEFRKRAFEEGYTIKVVGDYSFRKPKRKNGKYQFIKLWGANTDLTPKISYFEQ